MGYLKKNDHKYRIKFSHVKPNRFGTPDYIVYLKEFRLEENQSLIIFSKYINLNSK